MRARGVRRCSGSARAEQCRTVPRRNVGLALRVEGRGRYCFVGLGVVRVGGEDGEGRADTRFTAVRYYRKGNKVNFYFTNVRRCYVHAYAW